MQLTSKYKKGSQFLFYVFDIFSINASVVPLKSKEVITIINAFRNMLDSTEHKSKKATRQLHRNVFST